MAELEHEIAELIQQYQAKTGKLLTIGSVESATGGRISDKITNVSGSSDYYKGSIIAYSNEIKVSVVGVKEKTLKTYGAVSSETAIEMAAGGRKLLNVDICISDTGIAGPTGATCRKTSGAILPWTICQKHLHSAESITLKATGRQNKQSAAEATLKLLKEYLQTCLSRISTQSS